MKKVLDQMEQANRLHLQNIQTRKPKSKQTKICYQKYLQFSNKTKNSQKSQIQKRLKKIQKWNNFITTSRQSFSQPSQEHMQPNLSNWRKQKIIFPQRTFTISKHVKRNFKEQTKPNQKQYSQHYIPILEQKLKYNQDYQLSVSKFGDTWVDKKIKRIIPKMNLTPFITERRNDDFKFYRYPVTKCKDD